MTTEPAFSLARRLRAGETVYSGWCGLPAPIVAELVGREGFPAVTLDGQHGLWDTASVLANDARMSLVDSGVSYAAVAGSLSEAARRLHFSYRRAWMLVDAMNRRWPAPLVTLATGGKRGGGARLTDLGRRVLRGNVERIFNMA